MKAKKTILLALAASIVCLEAKAQLKVTSLNNVAIGATGTLGNVKFQVIGTGIFSSTGTVTSAAYIRGNSIFSAAAITSGNGPDYTWYGDDNTGLFHPAQYVMGFSIGGNERMRLNGNGQLVFNNSASASSPDITWTSDLTTGIFHPASSLIGLTVGGSEKARINSSGQMLMSNTVSAVGTPEFSWTADPSTGLYRPAAWQIGVATGGTERMRISWNGNIGIGQTNPAQTLDVNGNILVEGGSLLLIHNTNKYLGQCYGTDLGLINKDGTWLRVGGTNGVAVWGQAGAESNSTPNLFVNSYGAAVGGTSGTTTYANSTYAFIVTGSALASGGTWVNSDKRFKKGIAGIDGALDKVLKLKGATYEYNKDDFKEYNFRDGKNLGFIAQELAEVLPEAVQKDGKGFYNVNYDAVIPVLVEAIKEQHKIIQNQQNKMDTLQNALDHVSNQVNTCCQSISGAGANSKSPATSSASASVLYQNIPNPFANNTEITYTIAAGAQKAAIYVFDMQGTLLKTFDNLKAGTAKLLINGGELKPAMYLYSLVVDGKEIDTKRMILTN